MNTSINMDIPAYVKVAADPARVIGLNTVGMTRNEYHQNQSVNQKSI
jgi:acyl-[acyl carrier protein]--UDP-N-acetylglucosamine O-acyltransferase